MHTGPNEIAGKAKISPVSVVMATYNGERFLAAQVDSVLADLEAEDELIIVDDFSKDRTKDIIRSFSDARIRFILRESNQGVLRTFEEGLNSAKNNIIFLCDQDDIWVAGKRSAFQSTFEHNRQCLLVISDAQVIDAEDSVLALSFMATRGGFRGSVFDTLLKNRYLGCAIAIRSSLLKKALPIPDLVPMHDMWLGVIGSLTGQVHYLSTPYIKYRRHGGNLSPESSQSFSRMLKWRLALFYCIVKRLFFNR